MIERSFRQSLGIITPPLESNLTDLSPGDVFFVAGTELQVREICHFQQKVIVACPKSTFSQVVRWAGLPKFIERLNPEVGKSVDVVVYRE